MVPHALPGSSSDGPGHSSTGPEGRRILSGGVTSRRTSVADTHAVDLVEAKGLRLEVVGSCLATVGGFGAWVRAAAGQETRDMTTDKARQRAVRSRMQKTGERYAAARRHVVRDAATPPLPPRAAEPAVSEAAIVKPVTPRRSRAS